MMDLVRGYGTSGTSKFCDVTQGTRQNKAPSFQIGRNSTVDNVGHLHTAAFTFGK